MELEILPPLPPTEQQALRIALTRLGIACVKASGSYGSAWRREASREALENNLDARYARSPLSTPGATRA
ncbi:hypothetical protein BH20ACT13_BH20ACT13_25850 [soil metagenome]